MLFEQFLDFLLAWFRSRSWIAIAILGVLVGCLPLAAIVLVVVGLCTPLNVLAGNYHSLIEKELESLEAPDDSSETTGPNRELQIPLRRLLQMDLSGENPRVKYFVASELAQQGRLSMAARMMRDIAPRDSAGYPDAHAWLAVYVLSRSSEEVDVNALRHDLKVAIDLSSLVSAPMILAYAQILKQQGLGSEALAILRSRRQQFPDLNTRYAELAKELGEKDDLRIAIREGTEQLETRFKSGEGGVNDILQLVSLAILEKKFDRAISIAQGAVNQSPETAVYRQVYSSALLAKYISLGEEENVDVPLRMQYLDAAFKAFPSNEKVVAEVAKAIASGVEMPTDMRTEVENLLADGKAPAIAHLMLANNKLNGEEPETAIVHLELALRQMPNSAIVMNNLAVALLQARPEEIDRAEKLVDQALAVPGSTAPMLASMLDTQGQIRLAKEDLLGAIDSFEKAINLDRSKLNTRGRLAETYEQVGMTDLAAVQRRRIA